MLRLSGNCLFKIRLNTFKNFNKFPIRNFYFQESSHGAGEVNKTFTMNKTKYNLNMKFINKYNKSLSYELNIKLNLLATHRCQKSH